MFKGARLKLVARIEIRVTAPGSVGKVVRYTIRKRKLPGVKVLCLPPGGSGHGRPAERRRQLAWRTMRFAVMIEGQENVGWDDWVGVARACERLGFEALFRSDHYGSVEGDAPRGSLDAWATLCGLAAITSEVRLGTLVSPATFRHPSVLAKCAVTADHISGGRIELGIGTGWHDSEHRAYGFPFPPMKERMDRLPSSSRSSRARSPRDRSPSPAATTRSRRSRRCPSPCSSRSRS